MTEIIVRKALPPIDWTGIPFSVRATMEEAEVSAVVRSEQEAQDLVRWFGDERFCPFGPVGMYRPEVGIQFIAGAGYADVAELRDLCVTTWGRTTARLAENNGRMFDFDALREKHNLMRREQVDAAMRNAMTDRIAEHRRNLRTDKPRDPMRDTYERVTFSRYTYGGTA